MNLDNLTFLTELTDEDASKVNGGAIQDISDTLFSIFPGVPDSPTIFDSPFAPYYEPLWIYPVTVEPTDFGVPLG